MDEPNMRFFGQSKSLPANCHATVMTVMTDNPGQNVGLFSQAFLVNAALAMNIHFFNSYFYSCK